MTGLRQAARLGPNGNTSLAASDSRNTTIWSKNIDEFVIGTRTAELAASAAAKAKLKLTNAWLQEV